MFLNVIKLQLIRFFLFQYLKILTRDSEIPRSYSNSAQNPRSDRNFEKSCFFLQEKFVKFLLNKLDKKQCWNLCPRFSQSTLTLVVVTHLITIILTITDERQTHTENRNMRIESDCVRNIFLSRGVRAVGCTERVVSLLHGSALKPRGWNHACNEARQGNRELCNAILRPAVRLEFLRAACRFKYLCATAT